MKMLFQLAATGMLSASLLFSQAQGQTVLSGDHTGDSAVTSGTTGNLTVKGTGRGPALKVLGGNVGIGLSDPVAKFHVRSEAGNQYTILAENDDPVGSSLQFRANAPGGHRIAIYSLANVALQGGGRLAFFDETIWDSSSHNAPLATLLSLSAKDGMTLYPYTGSPVPGTPGKLVLGGPVGIGTSAPEADLEVHGDVKITGKLLIPRQGDILMGEFGEEE